MSTKKTPFQSNETLEACDVKVTQDGRIEIDPRDWNDVALQRLGTPEKAIRGRVTKVEQRFVFAPYAEASRKPTFDKKVVVGSTTLQCTEDKIKISFLVPRHLRKDVMVLYIQSEMDEVKRRLVADVYDMLASSGQQTIDNGQQTTNREQSSSLELPRCEGGKACAAELTETSTGGSPLTVDRCPLSTEETKGGAA